MRLAVMLCLACLTPATLFAQTARDAVLQVTVLDETRGVLPGATVTLAGIEASNKAVVIAPAATTPQGQVKFEGLAPGRYSITAEFSGFQTRTLPDVRIRSGENKQVVVLPIDRLQSSVTVERDRQQSASDRDVTFGTVMTREQIEALSDDPDELRRQLMDIAGPGAQILIDSFEGRDLPPKALIKSIRVTRDQFAPEVHFAGQVRIEILTQPGIGPIRGTMRSGFYDSATDGRNPLVNQTGPAQSWQYGIGLNGTLINERASFSFNFNGQDSYSTPVLYAATPFGQVAGNIPLRSPADNYFYAGGVDYAMTRDQVLRVNFQGSQFNRGNVGIGAYDLPERAYTAEDSSFGLYVQQNGPIGRRFVLNTRLSVFGSDSVSRSAVEAPTIVVNDAFTSGGAQRRGGTHARNYWLNSDLDYVRGIHSMRVGIEVQAGTYNTDSDSNYLGTYVFESLEAFDARTPRSFSRRIGDASIRYRQRPGRRLLPGRHQDPQGPDADRRRPLRSADARAGQPQLRAARRRHLGAVQERQDDAPRQLGHVLRLVADRHLPADAADRRLPSSVRSTSSIRRFPIRATRDRRRRPTATCSPRNGTWPIRSGSAPASRRRSRAGSTPTSSTATAIATRC